MNFSQLGWFTLTVIREQLAPRNNSPSCARLLPITRFPSRGSAKSSYWMTKTIRRGGNERPSLLLPRIAERIRRPF
jgi:hypothetical protein